MPQRIWRTHCPIEVREMQHRVLDASVHLLMIRQNGPTAFTVLDENDKLTYQVYLGDPHKCSCKYFQRINDLCAHICWVLLKKMQLDPKDPISFQLGMLPREITECLQPQFIARAKPKKIDFRKFLNNKDERNLPSVKRRAIRSGDSCPVCLELFEEDDKHQNITYCRHGCGNCIHVRCMELIAKHQLESHNECLQIICPLCRGDFGTMSDLRSVKYSVSHVRKPLEKKVVRHTGYNCCSCDVSPVLGNLYRCLQCTQVTFCQACVNSVASTAVYHEVHGFAIKVNEGDRWKPIPHFSRNRGEVDKRKLPPLIQNGCLKAAIDIADGVRPLSPPALRVPVAVSRGRGQYGPSHTPHHLLPTRRIVNCTTKTRPEAESSGEMGGGRLFGLLVQPAARGASVADQSGGAAPEGSTPGGATRPRGSRPRLPPAAAAPAGPSRHSQGGTQTEAARQSHRRVKQVASVGERGAGTGGAGAAAYGRPHVSETVKRMFPPTYLGHGIGGDQLHGRWREWEEGSWRGAAAERDVTGAARLDAAPTAIAAAAAATRVPIGGQALSQDGLFPPQLQESGVGLLQDESVV